MSTIEILEFFKVTYCYPNISFGYRILLTMPVTIILHMQKEVFSKFKLLKNHLKSSMSEEMLNGLAIFCLMKTSYANK
jgi:glycopeptide antibiotics resistance protein